MDNKERASKLNIYLLGQPRITLGDKPVLTDLNTKAMVLIFYLAANNKKFYSRDVLSEMLWPDLPMENSKSNLRQVLSVIKKACLTELGSEDSIVFTDKGNCALNEQPDIFVDLPAFYQDSKTGIQSRNPQCLQQSIDLYSGSFLEGFYVKGSASVDEWILFERESVSRVLRESCKVLSSIHEEDGAYDKAVDCLNKLIKTDVLQEDVYRELMRLHYKNGDRNQAVALYNQCTKILRKELNISPMAETKKLYEQIISDGKNTQAEVTGENGVDNLRGILRFGNNFLVSGKGQKNIVLKKLSDKGGYRREVVLKSNPFGSVNYEGFYVLLEELLKCGAVHGDEWTEGIGRFFPELGSSYGGGTVASTKDPKPRQMGNGAESELNFAGMLYAIKSILENAADECGGILLTVEDYDGLDERTKQLICYLLGNAKAEYLYLLICYRSEEQGAVLQRGFRQMS